MIKPTLWILWIVVLFALLYGTTRATLHPIPVLTLISPGLWPPLDEQQ